VKSFGEPALDAVPSIVFTRLATGDSLRESDIRRAADLVLVARDQHAILSS
jgi:hypothetical protein